MPSAPRASAVILAGGASRRFPPNKLAADLDGVPLLWHALVAAAGACEDVVIVVGHAAPQPALPPIVPAPRIARDAVPGGGPLVGLVAGLEAVAHRDWALLCAGDAPYLRLVLLSALLARARETSADALALAAGGRPHPLPSLLRIGPALEAARALLARGEHRLRRILDELRTEALPEQWWRAYDPEGAWQRDVDVPEDLRGRRD